MMMVTSDVFWMSDRNRSSLRRTAASDSSFCSMVAPAIRITKKRTNTPMRVSAVAWTNESRDGNHPCQMQNSPIAIPRKLHMATGRQTQEPSVAMSARATKA